jgi:hypothetical protein
VSAQGDRHRCCRFGADRAFIGPKKRSWRRSEQFCRRPPFMRPARVAFGSSASMPASRVRARRSVGRAETRVRLGSLPGRRPAVSGGLLPGMGGTFDGRLGRGPCSVGLATMLGRGSSVGRGRDAGTGRSNCPCVVRAGVSARWLGGGSRWATGGRVPRVSEHVSERLQSSCGSREWVDGSHGVRWQGTPRLSPSMARAR